MYYVFNKTQENFFNFNMFDFKIIYDCIFDFSEKRLGSALIRFSFSLIKLYIKYG